MGILSSLVLGNVRDAELMISGKEGNYDLVLRTGAWGKDIVVSTVIAGALTAEVTAIPAAGYQVIEPIRSRKISGIS